VKKLSKEIEDSKEKDRLTEQKEKLTGAFAVQENYKETQEIINSLVLDFVKIKCYSSSKSNMVQSKFSVSV